MNKVKINEYVYEESLIDNFFIGKGRFYVEDERVNTKDEAKRKLLDSNGYLIDNPNYRFKNFEKDNQLSRYWKLG